MRTIRCVTIDFADQSRPASGFAAFSSFFLRPFHSFFFFFLSYLLCGVRDQRVSFVSILLAAAEASNRKDNGRKGDRALGYDMHRKKMLPKSLVALIK